MKCSAHAIPFCSICRLRRASVGSPEAFSKTVQQHRRDLKGKMPQSPVRQRSLSMEHIEPRSPRVSSRPSSPVQVTASPGSKTLTDFKKLPNCAVPEAALKDADRQHKQAQKHVETIKLARQEMAAGRIREGTELINGLLCSMIQETFELLGAPPGSLLLLGAGSFARGEMMPFSDCDICIAYEDGNIDSNTYAGDLLAMLIFKSKLAVFLMNPGCNSLPAGFSIDQEFVGSPETIARLCVAGGMTLCDAGIILSYGKLHERYEAGLDSALTNFRNEAVAMVVSEVLEHTASGLGALKFKGEIDLKNHLYRPIQKFVSLLALIFDKQLRPHKNSIDRLVELSNQGLLDKQLASPLIEALEWIMSVRLDRHTKKNSAADKLPCVELDKQKLELAVKVLTAIQERLNSYKQNRDVKVFLPPPSVPKKKFFFF